MNHIFLRSILTPHCILDWLKTLDPKKEFDYFSTGDCLIAQYVKAQGVNDISVGGDYVHELDAPYNERFNFGKEIANCLSGMPNIFTVKQAIKGFEKLSEKLIDKPVPTI